MKRQVFLGQHSIYSPFGGLQNTIDALFAGESAIRAQPLFDIPVASAQFPDTRFRDLNFAVRTISQNLELSQMDQGRMLFVYCAAKGDIRALESADSATTETFPSPLLAHQARQVTALLGLTPARTMVISNACASGAAGVEIAKEYLERDLFSCAVLFGFDCISRFVLSGFNSLGALSPQGARPFDAHRNGLTLGEGVAMAVLHNECSPEVTCQIAGAGCSNDANHRTGPSRTGDGLFRAALAAFTDALPEQPHIGAVKCHGTATVYNDAMEAKAIKSLFNDSIPPCFSVKGAMGHTSGSGSLLELIVASHILNKKVVPPTVRFETIGVEEPLPVSSGTQEFHGDAILCLSAGFGGLNSAIILKDVSK